MIQRLVRCLPPVLAMLSAGASVLKAQMPVDGFTLQPLSATFGNPGGNGNVNVTQTSAAGLWSATSNAPWITITDGATGNGNATVSYMLTANPGPNTRSGSITIAGNTFPVTQRGANNSGSRFVPVTPCRIADTRNQTGPYGGPFIAANTKRTFSITGASCSIPPTAQAFSLNITAVPIGPLGFLTVWPTGQAQPLVSTLNSNEGRIVANAAIVPSGTGGAIDLFVTDDSHVVIDIDGYFDGQNAAALPFFPLTPCRMADTRNPAGPLGGPALATNSPRSFNIPTGPCNMPASAQAYSLNATVVPTSPVGFLTLWPSSQPQPLVSTLNSSDGRVVANAAIVPAGASAAVSAFATGSTDLVLDTNGYFGSTGNTPALSFFPITPCRVADTRNINGPFGGPTLTAGGIRSFPIPQSSCGVPADAGAYALNVTAVPRGALQYLMIWPADQPQPFVSTLNSFQGAIVANAAIVPAAADGSVKVFTSDASDVVIDINGYFAREGTATQNQPAFSLSVDPLSRTITGGGTASYQVTVTSQNGFAGQVMVFLVNPTNNLSGATFSPEILTVPANGTATSILSLVSKPTGPFGTATMTIRAGSTGFPTQSQDISLTVNQPQAAPGFSLSVNPLSQTVTQGGTATYQVTVTSQNGFAGQVLVFLVNPPNNLSSATFTPDTLTVPANGSATSTLSLVSKPTGPSGTAIMSVRAGSTGFPTQSQDISLTVNPPLAQAAQVSIRQFQFSPTPVTVGAGTQVTWTNMDAGVTHHVVADGGQFASSDLAAGQTFTTMPATPGTYNYHCSIHPFMLGSVVVQ